MTEDHIGNIAALGAQLGGGTSDRLPTPRLFSEVSCEPKRFDIESPFVEPVAYDVHGRRSVIGRCKRGDVMPALRKSGRKVGELSWKIIVNEKNAHGFGPNSRRKDPVAPGERLG
jgi:hypothetical protein